MVFLSLYPQVHFRISRGAEWNGSYAAIEGVGDEVAYSAYVNALMEGRPRRNDPYTGRDDEGKNRQPESLFSIQFVPAYLIAFAARVLGISASTAFIALTPLAAGAASLTLFWLLALVTGNDRLAGAGTIVVLCLGTVIGGHGLFAGLFGSEPLYHYLMFLRRYQPAASFPLFVSYCAIVWFTVACGRKRAAAVSATGAGIIFGLLVFSYVYLWTAAAAWLVCLALLWVLVRPPGWKDSAKSLGIVAALSLTTLVPFALLYSNRAASMDAVQALEASHRPDLFRLPEIISFLVLLMLALFVRRKWITGREPLTLAAASFALMPILVFNQQIITGRSLQPLHYEMFVANYSVLIAVVLTAAVAFAERVVPPIRISRRALLWIAIASFEWGAYETFVATRRSMEFARRLDEVRPVALRLEELARQHDRKGNQTPATVLSTDLLAADGLPTTAPQAVLWAPHMLVFSGVTVTESKERFYQYLYYTGIGTERLREILTRERQYGFVAGLFGFERAIKGLSLEPKPITIEELQNELDQYAKYCASFTHERAEKTKLSYLIVSAHDEPNLSNLDRWYERDKGERIKNYTLFRVSLRDAASLNDAQTTNVPGVAGGF
jgi:hypothetical protein